MSDPIIFDITENRESWSDYKAELLSDSETKKAYDDLAPEREEAKRA